MATPERFELPTNWFEASYSIQLSYGAVGICSITELSFKGMFGEMSSRLLETLHYLGKEKARPPLRAWLFAVGH